MPRKAATARRRLATFLQIAKRELGAAAFHQKLGI
jgi:hypothetical protein